MMGKTSIRNIGPIIAIKTICYLLNTNNQVYIKNNIPQALVLIRIGQDGVDYCFYYITNWLSKH